MARFRLGLSLLLIGSSLWCLNAVYEVHQADQEPQVPAATPIQEASPATRDTKKADTLLSIGRPSQSENHDWH